MDIRLIEKNEMIQAKKLVLDVFMKYEAPDYGEQGVLTFINTALENDEYMSSLVIYGAYIENELAGIIATRNEGKHIALFFVKGKYHKQGIGRALFNQIRKEGMTVNSSPYAKKVYEHLGFSAADAEQAELGMRYIPMKYSEGCNKKINTIWR